MILKFYLHELKIYYNLDYIIDYFQKIIYVNKRREKYGVAIIDRIHVSDRKIKMNIFLRLHLNFENVYFSNFYTPFVKYLRRLYYNFPKCAIKSRSFYKNI